MKSYSFNNCSRLEPKKTDDDVRVQKGHIIKSNLKVEVWLKLDIIFNLILMVKNIYL